ncbi:SSD domain-containing protein [Trichostrongylus colubriformis]|uniref:SSD domain-containing protein n=1 Tax=Trichostrongylus colubriformis TaxID=6319 RepID=A0AAN8EU69_TRICO
MNSGMLLTEYTAFQSEDRVFHPLASTSIADMLEEFSQFNYTIIILGYVLMVIYAAFTQARIDGRWLAIRSNVALSFVGVILVTYASICGLGLSTAMGINFNAATTQIVPFLSLGLGIDDMFLLLHNYDEISHTMRKNEMGILLKETGMSVMVTSINNILAFCAGYVLPIPALRSFCSQTAVLLAFNLASLMFVFPAFIGLDLRRVRAGRRDLVYCGPPSDPNFEKVSEKSSTELSTNVSDFGNLHAKTVIIVKLLYFSIFI